MKNKVVLITGSSNGIGRETAFKFASEKAKVIITYCNSRLGGQNTEKRCRELGASETLLIKLDLRENKSITNAVDRVVKTFGNIDILINNAGVAVWKPLQEQNFVDIENQIRTNLEGLIKMTLTCLPHVENMIINIASSAGQGRLCGACALLRHKIRRAGLHAGTYAGDIKTEDLRCQP